MYPVVEVTFFSEPSFEIILLGKNIFFYIYNSLKTVQSPSAVEDHVFWLKALTTTTVYGTCGEIVLSTAVSKAKNEL